MLRVFVTWALSLWDRYRASVVAPRTDSNEEANWW